MLLNPTRKDYHMASSAIEQEATNTETKPLELPEHEKIAQLAYTLWQARGCPEGSSDVDWFQAAEAVSSQVSSRTAKKKAAVKKAAVRAPTVKTAKERAPIKKAAKKTAAKKTARTPVQAATKPAAQVPKPAPTMVRSSERPADGARRS